MRATLLLAALAALLFMPTGFTLLWATADSPQDPEPTAYSDGDDNLVAFRGLVEEAGYTVDANVGRWHPGAGNLVFVPEPTRPLTAGEASQLNSHLANGGSLWVGGAASAWAPRLADWGISVGQQRLLDLAPTEPGHVRLTGITSEGNIEDIISHVPATLTILDASAWTVILASTGTAALDIDGNGTIDRGDPPGPHPVGATRELAGGGRLIVTSDISWIADEALRSGPGNTHFADWLVAEAATPGSRITFDESQHGWTARERGPVAAVRFLANLAEAPAWMAIPGLTGTALAGALLVRQTRQLAPYSSHTPNDPVTPPERSGSPMETKP